MKVQKVCIQEHTRKILRRVGSTRDLSPPSTLTPSMHCNYFGALESTEGLQFPEEDLSDNLCLIVVNSSSSHSSSYPFPTPMAGSYLPGATSIQLMEARLGAKRTRILSRAKYSNIRNLCCDC